MATREQRFEALFGAVEVDLRRALVAAYGVEVGREAAADALGWAWEHLERVEGTANPAGYLFRVGQTAARRSFRLRRRPPWRLPDAAAADAPAVEPALGPALAGLSPRQRASVLLVHGWGHGVTEAATVLGCSPSTVRNHLDRAMTTLRGALGVDADGGTPDA